MTKNEVERYQKLNEKLKEQAELVLSVFQPLNDREYFTEVEFFGNSDSSTSIDIRYHGYTYGEDYDEWYSCPKSYLYMTKEELIAEKKRQEDVEKERRRIAAEKTRLKREKNKAEREKKQKDSRYKKYLKLKKEFEGKEE